MTDGGYDAGYHACSCFWGTDPSSLIVKLTSIVPALTGLQVIDAGCGEGKNALFLASKGAHVRAFDISEVAIRHAVKLSHSRSMSGLRFEIADVQKIALKPNSADIVIAYGLLHCLAPRPLVISVCSRLQRAVRKGGYMVVCAFNDRHQELEAHPNFLPTLLRHEDYVHMFTDWELIEASDKDLTERHPHNSITHTHSMTRILAKRLAG